jgi:TetR/AcrR family transcriptional repressor of nem operon
VRVTARADSARETRAALLDAGLRIAESHGLAGMSVNRVVAAAGVAKGTFYVHFPDRGAFLGALHQRFYELAMEAVEAAAADLLPGRERLLRGILAYLDVALRYQGVKALLLEARNDPAVADKVAARTADFSALSEPDLRAMGWSDAAGAARLVSAMSGELSLIEVASGTRDVQGRELLGRMLERLDLPG